MSDNDCHEFTHPETGEIHRLRRVSSFADMLDKYMLRQWQMKSVAHAVAQHNHLRALASMWETCGDAVKEALAYKPEANMGTAGHKAADLLDDGKVTTEELSHPDVRDIAVRYEALMAHYPLRAVMAEQRVFNLTVGYIGHFDRIWEVTDDFTMHGWKFITGDLIVGDMKTGNFLDNEICLQQAGYVNAEGIVGPGSESLLPMPDVRKDVAFIVHVPQSKDTADLIPIRLDKAWEAFQGLALLHQWNAVRLKIPTELRRSQERRVGGGDDLNPPAAVNVTPVVDVGGGETTPPTPRGHTSTPVDPQRRQALVERVKSLRPEWLEEMVAKWPVGVPTFKQTPTHTNEQLDAIEKVLDGIDWGGDPLPAPDVPVEPEPELPPAARWVAPDEGDDLTTTEYEMAQAWFAGQSADVQSIVQQWAAEAHAAMRFMSLRQKASQRRYAILTASCLAADRIGDIEVIRAVVGWVAELEMQEAFTTGAALGSLTIEQARRLAAFAEHFGTDIELIYTADGPTFRGDGLAALAA